MRSLRIPVLSLACLGLLAVQLAGLHMHMDAHGYVGVPVGTHVHRTSTLGHHGALVAHTDEADHHHTGDPDYEGDRDVVIELGAGISKILIFSLSVGIGLVIVIRLGIRLRIPAVAPRPRPRHERWRPPLRAPPAFSPH